MLLTSSKSKSPVFCHFKYKILSFHRSAQSRDEFKSELLVYLIFEIINFEGGFAI